ncbi:hypothetical protein LQG66_17765 [Bradyrhizobium ontarionense]|uniref:Uncharacterized protein n=1 Tax=Bradyrhizobium ontarionense TaxID=2898149 RepID=A0ABY3RLT7_9BRAD|nr:hypothetical protein [Bradyrhizobium sp. A19]UFZ08027.1 hypothetical protein LQG66_17765 [Bradyrhizobium sp. A19]
MRPLSAFLTDRVSGRLGGAIRAFLSGVMRSIYDDYWRRVWSEQRLLVSRDDPGQYGVPNDPVDELADPERVAVAVAGFAEVFRLFAGDPVVLQIIDGLAKNQSAWIIAISPDRSWWTRHRASCGRWATDAYVLRYDGGGKAKCVASIWSAVCRAPSTQPC